MDAFMRREDFDFVAPLVEAGARTYINSFRDAYTIVRTARGATWDTTGAEVEVEVTESPGVGSLMATSAGPGDTVDAVVVNLSAYRFRLPGDTSLTSNDDIVINGRRYLVNDVVRLPQFAGIVAEASLSERNDGEDG